MSGAMDGYLMASVQDILFYLLWRQMLIVTAFPKPGAVNIKGSLYAIGRYDL